jgi:hypothetical protein
VNAGEPHHGEPDINMSGAWMMVHVVGALIVRLAEPGVGARIAYGSHTVAGDALKDPGDLQKLWCPGRFEPATWL